MPCSEEFGTSELGDLSDRVVGVSIGNFDAFHLGHKELFKRLDERLALGPYGSSAVGSSSCKRKTAKIICSFYPHPRRVLHGIERSSFHNFPELWPLLSWRLRFRLARQLGFDAYHIWHFTKNFSCLSAEEFVARYLVDALNVKVVVVGHDWSFGKNRSGNTDLLKKLGDKYHFDVEIVPPIILDERRVSTRWLGDAVKTGDVKLAARLLGRYHSLLARVVDGEKRGRTLGFPTANFDIPRMIIPRNGVYATLLRVDGQLYPAVTNIGTRPTVGGLKRLVETHLFDQHGLDLYSKYAELAFVDRLRDEMKFGSVEELKSAILIDIKNAREVLAHAQV